MTTSYHRISGEHLADHLIYLSSLLPLPRPLSVLPSRCSCTTHCCRRLRVAIPHSIAVAAVPSIAIAVTIAIAPSIAIIAITLLSLHVLQMLLRDQSPSRHRRVAVVQTIASTFAVAVAPSIAVHHRCRCIAIAIAVAVIATAVAVAIAIAATTTARFC